MLEIGYLSSLYAQFRLLMVAVKINYGQRIMLQKRCINQTVNETMIMLSDYLNTVKTVLSGHPRTQGKHKKWLLKTGDPFIQVHLHYILVQGTQKRWLLKTGDPLIEMTT